MKLLVAVADYVDNKGNVAFMYAHTRNIYYKKYGFDITVLNFKAKENYSKDGIEVISLETYVNSKKSYDVLISHAANIRNNYFFLKKYADNFKKLIFFFHGHEVLMCNKVYSKPYPYLKRNYLNEIMVDLYDRIKLLLWRKYITKNKEKSFFIFVSRWMKNQFLKWTKVDSKVLDGRSSITYNGIGQSFEKLKFDDKKEKKFDFISIRSNIDGSKYGVDIINRLAKNTPDKKFLLIGKGDFFNHNLKAPNLTWNNMTLNHEQIIDLLQSSRFALMPTRTDAQGLMMCEMAAFGIPVITSDIEVCHEVFNDFQNVYFIDNEDKDLNLENFTNDKSVSLKHTKYYMQNTIDHEIELLKSIEETL